MFSLDAGVLEILVAENDLDMQAFYHAYEQEQAHIHFNIVKNGRLFLERLKSGYAGWYGAISDCKMPLLSGIEAIESLRAYEKRYRPGKKLPIAMLTAGDLDNAERRAKHAGVVDYIVKNGNPLGSIDRAIKSIQSYRP